METDQIKKVLTKLLELSKGFATVEDIDGKTKPFLATLILIARRNYPILHSISLLKDDLLSGDAILDLSRRVFEDMISVEFMLIHNKPIKDKEYMATKFLKFFYVERWINLEYLKQLGVATDSALEKEIMEDFEKVKQDFMRDGKVANSWSKTGLEGMIQQLVDAKVVTGTQTADLLQGYVLGNRKNHLSSEDAQMFAKKEQRETNLEHSLRIGLVIAIVSYIRLLSSYAKEIGNVDMGKELDKLFSELNVTEK